MSPTSLGLEAKARQNRLLNPRLALIALLVSPVGAAQCRFSTSAGAPGLYGTPYGVLDDPLGPLWENYRKKVDDHLPPYPSVSAANDDGGRVRFSEANYGCRAGVCIYQGPGLFVGTQRSQSSPEVGAISLVAVSSDGGPESFDVRMGFAEHLSLDGGAPFSAFITNNGGDDSKMDPYVGDWGVDGLEQRWNFSNLGPTWVISNQRLQLIAAASHLDESDLPSRANWLSQLTVVGATPVDAQWDTGLPSSQPLSLRWAIQRTEDHADLVCTVGGSVQLIWTFDDASHHGLRDPGNPDAVGYQGGALDLDALVPILYVSNIRFAAPPEPMPPATLELDCVSSRAAPSPMPSALGVGCACASTESASAVVALAWWLAQRRRAHAERV